MKGSVGRAIILSNDKFLLQTKKLNKLCSISSRPVRLLAERKMAYTSRNTSSIPHGFENPATLGFGSFSSIYTKSTWDEGRRLVAFVYSFILRVQFSDRHIVDAQ